ncbi:hypothetical protein ED312_13615 [Sinomicrobium pectinilyticum]|uniref:Inner membrane protein n=1 Tax=Sinomicrobium pectinilyticum TaxID=1084421 RepID=A0A3N0EAE4_SINP1|nr:YgjV family protein [Sinomicrobium pectinilyticum]RNL84719.1 hypothetical protein ED312_13615 [Sinomicrobium pectinilyticum]
MTEIIGYIAIGTGFFAITKKDMRTFRVWHLLSNLVYIAYGVLLEAIPIMIAGVVFSVIHIFHLRKLYWPHRQVHKNMR